MDLAGVSIAAFLIVAQAASTAPKAPDPAPADCGSLVVVRCATPAPAVPAPSTLRGARVAEPSLMDPVVIEAPRLPAPPSLQELLQRAARGDQLQDAQHRHVELHLLRALRDELLPVHGRRQ